MYNKKYTPKYDWDYINKKYLDDVLSKIFGVGFIYIGNNPSPHLKGEWKQTTVLINSNEVEAWIRIK